MNTHATEFLSRRQHAEFVITDHSPAYKDQLTRELVDYVGKDAVLDALDQIDEALQQMQEMGHSTLNEVMLSPASSHQTPVEKVAETYLYDTLVEAAGEALLGEPDEKVPDVTKTFDILIKPSQSPDQQVMALRKRLVEETGLCLKKVVVLKEYDATGTKALSRFIMQNKISGKEVSIVATTAKEAVCMAKREIRPEVQELRQVLGDQIEGVDVACPACDEPPEIDVDPYVKSLETHRFFRANVARRKNQSKCLMSKDLSRTWTYGKFMPMFQDMLSEEWPNPGQNIVLIGTGTSQLSGQIMALKAALGPFFYKVHTHCFDPRMRKHNKDEHHISYHAEDFNEDTHQYLLDDCWAIVSDAAEAEKQSFCGTKALHMTMSLLDLQLENGVRFLWSKCGLKDAIGLPCTRMRFGRYHNHEAFIFCDLNQETTYFLSNKQALEVLEKKERNNCRRNAAIMYGMSFRPAANASEEFVPRPPDRGAEGLARPRSWKNKGQDKVTMTVREFACLAGGKSMQSPSAIHELADIMQSLALMSPDTQINIILPHALKVTKHLLGARTANSRKIKRTGTHLSGTQARKANLNASKAVKTSPGLVKPHEHLGLNAVYKRIPAEEKALNYSCR